MRTSVGSGQESKLQPFANTGISNHTILVACDKYSNLLQKYVTILQITEHKILNLFLPSHLLLTFRVFSKRSYHTGSFPPNPVP